MTTTDDWKRIAGQQQSRADRLQTELEHADAALAWAIETLATVHQTLAGVQSRTAATITSTRRPKRSATRLR